MKFAVYVEGQSEMLFVADVLRKYSDYDPKRCGFLCINLTADDYEKVPFPQQGNDSSDDYYQIVNVNNDSLVISKLKKDIPGLVAQGYNVIIGLKDVYGEAYEQIAGGQPIVDRDKIKRLHKVQNDAIKVPAGCDCRLHFAIMEYETWMLALIEKFVLEKESNMDAIGQHLGIDVTGDPETFIYHPYPLVQKIFESCGEKYHKHGKETLSFLSTLSRDDYETLRTSDRCASFAKFIESLLGGKCPILP